MNMDNDIALFLASIGRAEEYGIVIVHQSVNMFKIRFINEEKLT